MNLIEVYQDTLDYSKYLLNSNTTKHDFSEILTNQSPSETNIQVVNSDSVSALTEWCKVGKTAVLNMASYKRPGGGVINGARAQEECLFRYLSEVNQRLFGLPSRLRQVNKPLSTHFIIFLIHLVLILYIHLVS